MSRSCPPRTTRSSPRWRAGTCSCSIPCWPPEARRRFVARGDRVRVGKTLFGLLHEALVHHRSGFVTSPLQEVTRLFGSGRQLVLGGVLERVVRLEDQLEDLPGFHADRWIA